MTSTSKCVETSSMKELSSIQRDQREGETADEYITALYELIETCEYGTLNKEILRDRLVVGIRDKRMSEKLQLEADLTLESAKKSIHQKETVRQQSKELAMSTKQHLVEDVTRQTTRRPPRSRADTASKPQDSATPPPQNHKIVRHLQNAFVAVEESIRGMRSAQPGMLSAIIAKREATSKPIVCPRHLKPPQGR